MYLVNISVKLNAQNINTEKTASMNLIKTGFLAATIGLLSACGGGSGGDDVAVDTVTASGSGPVDTSTEQAVVTPLTQDAALTASIEGSTDITRSANTAFLGRSSAGVEGVDFEWTLVTEPEGAITYFDQFGSDIVVQSSQIGDYRFQLIASEGGDISDPAFVDYTVTDRGVQPPAPMLQSEVNDRLALLLEVFILPQLNVPGSFTLTSIPSFAQLPADPSTGGIVIDFTSQNAFGVPIANTSVCLFEWSGYFWGSNLDANLQPCQFL